MIKILLLVPVLVFSLHGFAQPKMSKVEELINTSEPGWPLVKSWIDSAKNKVEVLPVDSAKAREALYQTQVNTASPMGAIIYETGGLLIDRGWIRVLGSGSAKITRSLPAWNKGKAYLEYGNPYSYLLIADDVLGGFFAINGGAFGKELGKIYYLAPDNLEWENLNYTYPEFLMFCFKGNLDSFYEGYRWNNWQKDVAGLQGDKVFSFFPFLWSMDWKDINKVAREPITIGQQFAFTLETRRKLGFETNFRK